MELENILEESLKMKKEYEDQLEVLENDNESLMSQINKLRSELDSWKNKMA
jgi:cell division protein FtsB